MRKTNITNYITSLSVVIAILMFASGCGSSKKVITNTQNPTKEKEVDRISFNYTFIEANKQKILGNIPLAMSLYLKCLEYNPKSAAVNFQLSKLHILKNDINGSLIYAEKAVEIDSVNIWYNKLLLSLYRHNNKPAKAHGVLNKLFKLYPKNIQIKTELINSLINNDEDEKALKLCNELEEEIGISEEISLLKKRIFVKRKEYESAYKTIKDIIVTFPDKYNYYGVLAELYNSNEELDKAEKTYKELLVQQPDYGLGYLGLAELLIAQKKIKESTDNYIKGFKSSDTEFTIKLNSYLALVNYMKKDTTFNKTAEALIDTLIVEHPKESHLHLIKSDYCFEKKNYECAKDHLLKTIEGKTEFTVWQQLLFVLLQLKENDDLIKYSDKAIERYPSQSVLYFFKALGLHYNKEHKKAIKNLEKSLKYIGNNNDLKINVKSVMGDVYFELKDYERMYKEYDEVLLIDPDNLGVLNNYGYYLSLRNKDLNKAEQMSKKCVDKEPENSTYLDTYAWILFKLKNYKDAIVYIEKALKHDNGNNAVLIEHYGDILFMSNNKTKAIEQWKKADKIGGGSDKLKEKIKKKSYIEEVHE